MYKKYYGDEERANYVKNRMSELSVQEEYREYIADILLRKAYEYELTDEEVAEDIDTLVHSLQEIVVEEAPKGSYNSWGAYFAEYKKVLINDRTLVEANDEQVYGTFAHELYHALTHDFSGNDRIEWFNPVTQETTASLREAIVERASARTIRPNGISKENPYYKNYTTGYSLTTFVIPLISAVAGVNEKEVLKYAMKSGIELEHFLTRKELCDKGEERVAKRNTTEMLSNTSDGDWSKFYDSLVRYKGFIHRLEANLSMIHNACYREDKEPLSKKEANNWIRDGFLGICDVCAEMFKERTELSIDNKSIHDNLKFSYNQMCFIIDESLRKFSSNMLDSKTTGEISEKLEKQRAEVFNVVAQKVGMRTPRRSTRFELTEDMLKYADIPNEEEKEWFNKQKIEEFKKLVKSKKITVYRDYRDDDKKKIKGYFRHSYYRYLTDFMIGRMNLPKEYKSILADVMLRRGYQYRHEPSEMMSDLEKLYQRLETIDITMKDEGYDSFSRKLNIKSFSLLQDSKLVYENFAVQAYKMLAGDNLQEDRNDIAYNSILERAVHRTIYDKPKTSNPYYNNVGVNDQISYAVELVSLAYGMPEYEVLKEAINGKEQFLKALSEANQEPIEKTEEFWKKLNRNLLIVKDLKLVKFRRIW